MEILRNHIKNIEASQKETTTNGLVLQSYCNSILQQPNLDFSSSEDLVGIQNSINNSIENAKESANSYLSDINPKVISSLSDLKSYFTVYRVVPVTLPEGATVDQWLSVLTVIKGLTENNLRNSEVIVQGLNDLSIRLKADAIAFNELAQKANEMISGDQGELADISDELKSIDRSINAQISAIVGEGIAIAGGVVMIGMGAVASPVGAELIAGGVVTVVAGGALLAASIIELKDLYNQKNSLFQSKATLEQEILLLGGIESVMDSLSDQAKIAAEASEGMTTIWQDVSVNLDRLINDLTNGITSTDEARTFFLNSANNEIADLQDTITTITQQLAGVVTITLPEGETVIDYLEKVS